MTTISRRGILRASFATAAAAALHASAAPFARIRGANDDIRIAVVGIGSTVKIGGKGKQDIRDWLKTPGVRIVALCDCDRAHLDPEVQKLRDRNINVESYTDVRKLLEDRNIDAISITTPNHWHALMSIWACQAGKDVFVQKPASHNIFEGRQMVEAARRYNRIVLSTAGPRDRTGMGEAFQFAREGRLGRILYVHGLNYKPRASIGKVPGPQPLPPKLDYDLWSGPAPIVPLRRQYLHYDWHWDWLYGNGDLGNMGIHYMDGCRWALNVDALPPRVLSVGGRFGYDDDGQTPNTLITLLDYQPVPIIFEVRGLPKKRPLKSDWSARDMDSFRGMQIGTMIHCENGYISANKAFDNSGKLIRTFEPTNEDLMVNFAKAVRSRRVEHLQSDILQGHLSAALVHMANISHRLGQSSPAEQIRQSIRDDKDLAGAYDRLLTHLDANGVDLARTPLTLGASLKMDSATERFTGPLADEANRLRTREYRPPFVVPEKV